MLAKRLKNDAIKCKVFAQVIAMVFARDVIFYDILLFIIIFSFTYRRIQVPELCFIWKYKAAFNQKSC